jgi:hypothetical protein
VQLHPLIELSNQQEVRQAKGFKDAAAALSGGELAELYEGELANAPKRAAVGKKFLVRIKPPSARRAHRDEEHLSLAVLKYCRDSGAALDLPHFGSLHLLAAQVPLATASADRSVGDSDPKGRRQDRSSRGRPRRPSGGGKLRIPRAPGDARREQDTPLRTLWTGSPMPPSPSRTASLSRWARRPDRRTLSEGPSPESCCDSPLPGSSAGSARRREAAWIRRWKTRTRCRGSGSAFQVMYLAIALEDPGWCTARRPRAGGSATADRRLGARAGVVRAEGGPGPGPRLEPSRRTSRLISRPIRSYW